MSPLLATLCATSLSVAGMAALAAVQERHYAQITGRDTVDAHTRTLLQVLGTLTLALAWVACWRAWGGVVGSLLWLGLLSCAALGVAVLLAYAPRRHPGVGSLGGGLGLVLLGYGFWLG